MEQPVLSVVIPTRSRRATLARTLEALERQSGLSRPFEVIVVDDGSDDDTWTWLQRREPRNFELVVRHTTGIGPAGARNLGVGMARASRILLLGDDTIPAPTALAAHLVPAGSPPVGIQGMIEWDPEQDITEVMRFLAPEGPQFWFKGLSDGDSVPFTSVYGSNLSAPKQWLTEEPFDEGFDQACFEDTEQAWRWRKRGWNVVFGAEAVCFHVHRYDDLQPFLGRLRFAGWATRRLVARDPAASWALVIRPALSAGVTGMKFLARLLTRREGVNDRRALHCAAAFFSGLAGIGTRTDE